MLLTLMALIAASQEARADITSNLIGYYRFEGNYTDTSGNNNLTNSGANVTARGYSGTGITTANNAYARSTTYNGVNDIATNDAFTFSAWIYPTTISGSQSIVSRGDNVTNLDHFYFGFDASSRLAIFGANLPSTYYGVLTANRWYHVAATYNRASSRMRLFVNGAEVKTASVNGDIPTDTSDFCVGCNIDSGVAAGAFHGRIDELRLYSRELTPSDVAELSGGRFTGRPMFWINNTNDTAFNTTGAWSDVADGTSNGTTPGANDRAIFTGANSRRVAISSNVTVNSIDVQSSRTAGNITVGSGITVDLASNFYLDGNVTFSAASGGRFYVGGSFNQSTGTFTAPSGTMYVNGAVNQTAGTFTHNSGTLQLDAGENSTHVLTSSANAVNQTGSGGLVHWWKFDENSSTTATDSIGGNTGTLTNSPTWTTTVPATSFSNTSAVSLTSASSQYIALASPVQGTLGTTATVSAWFKTTQTGAAEPWNSTGIIGTADYIGPVDVYWGWLDTTGKINLRAGDDAVDNVASTSAVNDGLWHHVVMTRNSTTGALQIYVDGTINNSSTGDTGAKTAVISALGRITDSASPYWNGQLDDIRVFNRVLNSYEVAALAAGRGVTGASGTTQTINSSVTVAGTMTISSATLALGSSANLTLQRSFNAPSGRFSANAASTVTFGGTTASQTITSNGNTFGNVTITGTGSPGWAIAGAFTAAGTLTVNSASGFNLGSAGYAAKVGALALTSGLLTSTNGRLEIEGAFTKTSGTFTHNSGTVVMKSTTSQPLPAVTFNTLFLNDGMAAYWPFDETTGSTARDASGLGNDTLYHATPTQSTTTPTLGFTNPRSLGLNGTNASGLGAPNGLPRPQDAQTVSLWVYYASVPADTRQFYTAWNSDTQVATQVGFRSGTLRVCKYGGSTLLTTTAPSTSTWHHLVYTNDGSNNQALWVDGTRVATSTTATNSGSYDEVTVGSTSGASEAVTANIDEVRVYKRKLSDDEIRSLAAGYGPSTSQATYTVPAAMVVDGDLNIVSGTLDISAAGLTVKRNVYNWGGKISAGTQTLTLSPASNTTYSMLSNGARWHAVSMTGTATWALQDPLDATGVLTMATAATTPTLTTNSYLVRVAGINQTVGTYTPGTGSLVLIGSQTANTTLAMASTPYALRIENPDDANLVGYWKMDEGTGSSISDWSGSNAAIRTGGAFTTDKPSALTFPNRHAFDTKAGTGYATIPYNAAYGAMTSISVSMWIKQTADAVGVSCGGSTNHYFFFAPNTRGSTGNFEGLAIYDFTGWGLQAAMCDNSATDCDYVTEPQDFAVDGNWHHIVATFDPSGGTNNFKLYRDGSVRAQETHTTALAIDPARSIHLGRSGQCGSGSDANIDGYFQGNIDDVRIYNAALTQAQVTALYNGRYPSGPSNYAVQVSGTVNTGTNNVLTIDSGTLDVSTGTLNAQATTAAVVNAGKLAAGTGTTNLSGGLTVRQYGALDFPSTGTVNVTTLKTLTIDGTLSATAGATGTLQGSGGSFIFTVNSDVANPTATIDVDGLNIKYTDGNGMNVQKANTSTFTKFQNVNFSNGTGARYLYINGDSLVESFPAVTFDLGVARATTSNVVVAGSGSRFYLENRGTGTSGNGAGENYDSDGDTTAIGNAVAAPDGLSDSGTGVVQWVWSAPTDLAGSITGFPTPAFDWSNFTYYSTYVAMKDVDANGTDRIYVRTTNGSSKGYTWDLPSGVGDIIGTPRWDNLGGTRYVWVATTLGRIYRLVDGGSSLVPDASPWNAPFFQGSSATVSAPLLVNANYVYWVGNNSAGSPALFRLGQNDGSTGTASTASIATVNAAMAFDNPTASTYIFSATSGHVYRHDGTNLGTSPVDNTTLNPGATYGRIVVLKNVVYVVDTAGKLTAASTSSFSTGTTPQWTYQDTGTHVTCPAGGNCQALNVYVNLEDNLLTSANPRVTYGDKDGHVYLMRRNGSTSSATVFTGYPYQANGDASPISTSPLYQDGILVYGNEAGRVYVVDALSAVGPATPKLIQAYNFGNVAIASIARDRSTNSNSGAYIVATADGKIYYIPASSDPSSTYK